jgi:RNA polymerase sigma-70 factor (ECF subfamily)
VTDGKSANRGRVEDASGLMEAVKARDAQALEALYDGYHRLVYGLALRVLTDAGLAEDVTQAVFLKLWSDPHAFRGGNFAAWIARVARNKALDVARSRRLRELSELPAPLPAQDAAEDTALTHVEAEAVRAALAQLPSEQREPIELGFFGGITHAEIARRTGIPLGTVKTRIRSGLRRLRDELQAQVSV